MKNRKSTAKHIDVWIIEDKIPFRRNLSELINGTPGFRCSYSSSTCEEAIKALRTGFPPDVILLDIGLPGMSGIEGIQEVKAIHPGVEIIILTVYDDDDNVFKAICAGAAGYLLKTSREEEILDAIRDVVKGGSPVNAQIARKVLSRFSEFRHPAADYALTAREHEILELLVEGVTKTQIAEKLFLSYHTVDTHVRGVYQKLQVHSRSAAVAKALKERLL